ncbi:15768_t:CDS:2, partial [Rhizophagus irregularis]
MLPPLFLAMVAIIIINNPNYQQPVSNIQSTSNSVSPPQFFSPLLFNITINFPQTNFVVMPTSADIQQVLACLIVLLR